MRESSRTKLLWTALLAGAIGCVDRKPAPASVVSPEPADVPPAVAPQPDLAPAPGSSSAPQPTPPPAPASVEQLAVPGDLPAFVVRAADGRPPRVVFVPGICSNAYAYMLGFPLAAQRAGGVVAIDGDAVCPGVPGFRSFSWDIAKQHARIQAALAAAGVDADRAEGLTVIGYSQGASIVERLAAQWPARYARVVLISPPADPVASRFVASRAVVTMSCSRDVPYRMKSATRALTALGVPSTYVEMPGCTHGNLADGDAKFGEVFAWLDEHAVADGGVRPR